MLFCYILDRVFLQGGLTLTTSFFFLETPGGRGVPLHHPRDTASCVPGRSFDLFVAYQVLDQEYVIR